MLILCVWVTEVLFNASALCKVYKSTLIIRFTLQKQSLTNLNSSTYSPILNDLRLSVSDQFYLFHFSRIPLLGATKTSRNHFLQERLTLSVEL